MIKIALIFVFKPHEIDTTVNVKRINPLLALSIICNHAWEGLRMVGSDFVAQKSAYSQGLDQVGSQADF